MMNSHHKLRPQAGATLIEVLVSILMISIGILALSAALSRTGQMPKIAGYRATAVNLASGYIERMRANAEGFGNGAYDQPSSYDGSQNPQSFDSSKHCSYPDCNMNSIAAMDFADMKIATRAELPAGGTFMSRDSQNGVLSGVDGNLWIVWLEPMITASLSPSLVDHCPSEVTDNFSDPQPRCLYMRFKL
jgi:type IV pilus assembly protein PilV